MADVASSADTPQAPRYVVSHHCADCRCPGVENLRRSASSSSEASVGTSSSLLLPGGSGQSGAVVSGGSGARSAGAARFRGASVSGGSGGGVVVPNGAVNVDIGTQSDAGVRSAGDVSDAELEDDDDVCVADTVATNLEELNSGRYTKLKLAFDDWEKTFETFQKRREYKEAQRDAIRNEIYQVIGFYIVFQGVIFTAVAQASVLRCHNWWTSFLLSLLTSLVTIGAVLQKLADFWALETTIASEKSSAKVLKTRINDVKLKIGPKFFDFKKNATDGLKSDSFKPGFAVKFYQFSVITVLLCFSAIFLVSSWSILCKPGLDPGGQL